MEATRCGEKGPPSSTGWSGSLLVRVPDTKVPVIPEKVSHYSILNKLGAGGMGEVYLAEDTKLHRRVAIKFLPAELTTDKRANKRLIREAQASARLEHPNICALYELSEEAGRSFIVMQYVEGETLASRIRHKPLNLSECLEIATQIADALAEAHSHGIIHRDIKPQNIMLTARDQAKVMDFGLAKVIRDGSLVDSDAMTESLLTDTGLIMGTVTYMSPEQVRGESLDTRSDIFSLGAVLYEMFTGHQPFAADGTAMTVAAIVSREPAPLTKYSGGFPTELQRIVSKALQKDREQRYQTIKDLLIDLRSLKHHLEFEEELNRSDAPNAQSEAAARPNTQFTIARPVARAEYLLSEIKHHKRSLIIGLSVCILAVAVAAYFFYFARTAKAFDSIAVLPFVNVNGDPNTEYLSDGVAESLINNLTELRQLRVIARATAFRYKGKDVDPQVVGRELSVRAVLMGRVRQIGDTLNIQVDLVDAATGAQLWGREYERNVSNVLSVKQAIARDVTEKLKLGLSGEQQQQLTKRDTANTEAYQFYMRGRYFWNKRRDSAANLNKAIEEFKHAIDKDPNYGLAYVGLADSYVLLEGLVGSPWSESLPPARAAATRALQIDESMAEAHASLALIEQRSWNFESAAREYKRAIELNPRYPTAHQWYSLYLTEVEGKFDESLTELRLAQQLDSLSPMIENSIAASYLCRGELDEAIEAAKKVVQLDPNFYGAHLTLSIAYRRQRRYEEAITEAEQTVAQHGRRNFPLASLGISYAVAGDREKAQNILKELEEKYDKHEALGQHIASLYAALGDKEQAFAWLEKDFQTHSGVLPGIAYYPRSDVLRAALSSDPRWNDLLRRIGLPQS